MNSLLNYYRKSSFPGPPLIFILSDILDVKAVEGVITAPNGPTDYLSLDDLSDTNDLAAYSWLPNEDEDEFEDECEEEGVFIISDISDCLYAWFNASKAGIDILSRALCITVLDGESFA